METTTAGVSRRPLTEEQRSLATSNLALARYLARPWMQLFPDSREDFHTAARLGLLRAARTFDPSRGVTFSKFARHHILGGLADVRRKVMRRKRAQIVPGWVAADTRRSGLRLAFIHGEPPVGHQIEAHDQVERMLRTLPVKHAAACRSLYLEGRTTDQAASDLGYSPTRIAALHKEALTMLRWSFGPQAA
jgi:RNA polymerase sigma factor (sigma-70 family)